MPDEAGAGGTEVTGGAYVALDMQPGFTTGAAAGTVSNDVELAFVTATASWGTVRGITIETLATAGVLLALVTFASAVTVGNGDQLKFPIGNLILNES